jgi:hypothetical protein
VLAAPTPPAVRASAREQRQPSDTDLSDDKTLRSERIQGTLVIVLRCHRVCNQLNRSGSFTKSCPAPGGTREREIPPRGFFYTGEVQCERERNR